MTTRRYPRTLAEAWPQHYAWRGVVTHYRRPLAERISGALLASLIGLALAAALVHWWSA
jgi:hypothetical protein